MSRKTPTAISIVLVAGAIALAACGSSVPSTGASGYGATTPTTTAATMATSNAATPDTKGTSAVNVAHDAKLGDHLVDAQGRTLYLFEADHGLTTACTGSCINAWPAAKASKVSAGNGVDAAKLKSVTGEAAHQLAYAGHLLYLFAGDTKAGDANGVSIPKWYAVSPSGTSIEVH